VAFKAAIERIVEQEELDSTKFQRSHVVCAVRRQCTEDGSLADIGVARSSGGEWIERPCLVSVSMTTMRAVSWSCVKTNLPSGEIEIRCPDGKGLSFWLCTEQLSDSIGLGFVRIGPGVQEPDVGRAYWSIAGA